MRLASLLDFLFPPRADERLVRAAEAETLLALLRPTLVSETRPGTHALLPFHAPLVRALIHEAKYHGNLRAFELLALALGEYLADLDVMNAKKMRIVPVPLGAVRRTERGFNQAEEVVKRALRETLIALEADLLVRTRETASQVSLPREAREENMRGAFSATRAADPAYTYVLIDDVLTTGATLQAAIDALRAAGAAHIIPLALAH